MTNGPLSRRSMLGAAAKMAAALALPAPLSALSTLGSRRDDGFSATTASLDVYDDTDAARLSKWSAVLRAEKLGTSGTPLGNAAARVAELTLGTPYEANTLEAYLRAGGSATKKEPLTLSLTRFDCVTLVESSLAVARVARSGGAPSWKRFAREMERMRYRGGTRGDYTTRLHYFSEWIADGAKRGLLHELGGALGGVEDARPLRFMSEHRGSYAALADDRVVEAIKSTEKRLDNTPRRVIPTAHIANVADRIETGDVLAFATSIVGLDVTHTALAYRDATGTLRVLHAPLSGGTVEVSRLSLTDYVAAIRRSTGILVARPA